MKIRLVVLSLFCLVVLSCNDGTSTTEILETKTTTKKPIITSKAIENFDYTDYALSPDGEKAVALWERYNELAIQIEYLKKADLSFFNGDNAALKKIISELKITTPSVLKTNPIESRSILLETTILKLNENLTIDNIEDDVKLQSVKDVLVAFSNFNYQINKKLERDIYDKIQPE